MADDTKPKDEQTPIPYWGYFGQANTFASSLEYDPETSPPARQFLEGLRHYDPDATFVPIQFGQSTHWQLQYDPKKLPGGGPPGVDLNANAYDPMYWNPTSSPGENWQQYETYGGASGRGHGAIGTVKDPSGVQTSPVWGTWTPASNFEVPDDSGLFSILGPLGVIAFAAGIPMLAGAMSNGAIGGGGLFGLGAGGGAAPSGGMLPMMPTTDPYVPMLPFNPADPSYAITAGAAGGGGLSGAELLPLIPNANPYDIMLGQPYALGGSGAGLDQTLLPLIPNANPYNPMLPFNPADPSYSGLPHGLWDRFRNTMGKIPPGGLPGMGGTGAEGLLGGGGGARGGGGGGYPYEDALSILARFYGLPEEAAKRAAKAIADKGDHHGSYF